MVRALAGDSTTTSVLDLADGVRTVPDAFRVFAADDRPRDGVARFVVFLRFRFFVVFAIRSVSGPGNASRTVPCAAQQHINTLGSLPPHATEAHKAQAAPSSRPGHPV